MSVKQGVKTAGRTLDVFEAFQVAKRPLSLSELARMIDVPVSSCHGLVHTLRALGYLYSLERQRTVYPTRKILDVAETIAAHDPIADRLHVTLTKLRDATGETIVLGKRQDDCVVYLDVIEGMHTIRFIAKPGDLKPLHSSALGKSLLAQMSDRDLDEFLTKAKLEQITPNTITDRDSLRREVLLGRRNRYCTTRGENVDDVMAVAAPLVVNGEPCSVAVAGPLNRMTKLVEQHRDTLLRELAHVSA